MRVPTRWHWRIEAGRSVTLKDSTWRKWESDTIASVKRRVMLTLTNILAGLSLILALSTGGLWGRSYWVADGVQNDATGFDARSVYIVSCPGRVAIHSCGVDGSWPSFSVSRTAQAVQGPTGYPGFGFEYGSSATVDGTARRYTTIVFPYWSLLLALAILPALHGWQLLRSARRRSENLCPQCGYDLRATPQRCPECGHETTAGARVILK
jgi:hypothetical protein